MANLELHNPPRFPNRWTAPETYVNVQSRLSTGDAVRVQRSSIGSTRRERDIQSSRQSLRPTLSSPAGRPRSTNSEALLTSEGKSNNARSLSLVYTKDKPLPPLRNPDSQDTEQDGRGRSAPPISNGYSSAFWPVISLQNKKSASHRPTQRPLPPVPTSPAQFRLGGKEMPWSVPTPDFSFTPAPETSPRTSLRPSSESTSNRSLKSPKQTAKVSKSSHPAPTEDPRRVENLSALSTAMMNVGTPTSDNWDAWTWDDGVGVSPREPRSSDWVGCSESTPRSPRPPPSPPSELEMGMETVAAAEEGQDEDAPKKREPWQNIKLPEEEEDLPPPYCVSQWEARWTVLPTRLAAEMGVGSSTDMERGTTKIRYG